MIAQQENNVPGGDVLPGSILKMKQELIDLAGVVATVDDITRLDEDVVAADPGTLIGSQQASALQSLDSRHVVAVKIRDGIHLPARSSRGLQDEVNQKRQKR